MSSTNEAILFPGQGAQYPGMGRAWAEGFPEAQAVFDEADRVLDMPLSRIVWAGDERIHRTDVAQPAILTTSVAIVSVLVARGLDAAAAPLTAGLSLGEYTALWCAGSLSFSDAVRLVRLRGEAMQAASDAIRSSMTSLMGASREVAEELASIGARRGICSVANLNAPGQIVLSGELAALDAVEAAAREHGVKRAVRLTVAGGFHSECMRPASERLAAALAEVSLSEPKIPFVTNVTGGPLTDPAEIKDALALQVCAPVLWEKGMRWALDRDLRRFLEPGPGSVLAGLLRRIAKDAGIEVEVRGVERPEDLPAP